MSQNAPAWKLQAGLAQNVAIGAASIASTAMGAQTYAARLSCTSNCHIRVTQNGASAVAADTLLKASDPPSVIGISPGDIISVIQDTAAGVLNISQLTH